MVLGAGMVSGESTVDTEVRRGACTGRGGGRTSTASSRRRGAPAAAAAGHSAAAPSTGTAPATVGGGAPGARAPRPKRIRTTFKCHELQLMKTYFELNHNPDNNDLKQLSIKTGLSKRVLQASPWPTQPSTFSGTANKYRPKCGDAPRLGSTGIAHSVYG